MSNPRDKKVFVILKYMNMETEAYFGGKNEEEEKDPEFSEEVYAASIAQDPIDILEEKVIDLVEQIDLDKDNELKKKNAPNQGIDPTTLAPEVKTSEKLHKIHEKQLEIVKQKIKEKKKKPKPKSGPRLGSFLGF